MCVCVQIHFISSLLQTCIVCGLPRSRYPHGNHAERSRCHGRSSAAHWCVLLYLITLMTTTHTHCSLSAFHLLPPALFLPVLPSPLSTPSLPPLFHSIFRVPLPPSLLPFLPGLHSPSSLSPFPLCIPSLPPPLSPSLSLSSLSLFSLPPSLSLPLSLPLSPSSWQ